MATTHAPNNCLGPPNPTKKLAHWVDLLGQPLTRNHVFEIFRPEPPTPPSTPLLNGSNQLSGENQFMGHDSGFNLEFNSRKLLNWESRENSVNIISCIIINISVSSTPYIQVWSLNQSVRVWISLLVGVIIGLHYCLELNSGSNRICFACSAISIIQLRAMA